MEIRLKNKLRIKLHTVNKLHLLEDSYGRYWGSNDTTEKLFPLLISLPEQSLGFTFFPLSLSWGSLSWHNPLPGVCQLGTTELGVIFALRDDQSVCHPLLLRPRFLGTGHFSALYSTMTAMWLRREILQILNSFFGVELFTATLCPCKHFQVPFRAFPSL